MRPVFSYAVSARNKQDKPSDPNELVTPPVKFTRRDIAAIAERAAWEGMSVTDYWRSGMRARTRETDIKRAEHERRLKGETG